MIKLESMIQSMLILTDFSEAAFRAAEYACYWTKFLHTRHMLLYHSYQTYLSEPDFPPVAPGNFEQIYMTSMEELGLLHDRLKPLVNHDVTIELLAEDVSLPDVINQKCADKAIDMVVAGSSPGRSGIERLLVGSTAAELVKACRYPVLIVPPDAQVGRKIENIVFATDLDDYPILPISKIEALLEAFNAQIMVVNVQPKSEDFSVNMETAIPELHKLLDKYHPEFHYLKGDNIAQSIFDFSKKHKVSLIIAVPKKHGIFYSLFQKSTTRQLTDLPSIPVLSLPALG